MIGTVSSSPAAKNGEVCETRGGPPDVCNSRLTLTEPAGAGAPGVSVAVAELGNRAATPSVVRGHRLPSAAVGMRVPVIETFRC